MFNKRIIFEIDVRDIAIVGDRIGELCVSVDFADGNLSVRSIYCCTAKVKFRKYEKCLAAIDQLHKDGINIQRLVTV